MFVGVLVNRRGWYWRGRREGVCLGRWVEDVFNPLVTIMMISISYRYNNFTIQLIASREMPKLLQHTHANQLALNTKYYKVFNNNPIEPCHLVKQYKILNK